MPPQPTPRTRFLIVLTMLAMWCVPAALTLHTARVSPQVPGPVATSSPYGYTVSLLLFVVPIVVILFWLVPAGQLRISKKSFVRTMALLFPLGAGLDFFFAKKFLSFPNPDATLRIPAWSRLPVEEVVAWIAVTYATVIV